MNTVEFWNIPFMLISWEKSQLDKSLLKLVQFWNIFDVVSNRPPDGGLLVNNAPVTPDASPLLKIEQLWNILFIFVACDTVHVDMV